MDERLSAAPYLAGSQPSYADIFAGVAMYRWMTMPIERPSPLNVEAWHGRLNERSAFRKGVCVSYEKLVGRLAF